MSPEPIELGQPSAESLTSYFRRVAKTNHTTPCEIAIGKAFSDAAVTNPDLATIRNMGMNGVLQRVGNDGPSGLEFARAFARLVGFPVIQHLHLQTTFPGWSLAGVFRAEPCWCPDCLCSFATPYTPVAWEMRLVTACTVHRRRLVSSCPKCEVIPAHTTLTPDPLLCPKCSFDRRNSSPGAEASSDEIEIALRIQELIAAITSGNLPPIKDGREWATGLVRWAQTAGGSSTRPVCERLGLDSSAVRRWTSGKNLPSLAAVLRAGLATGISLTKLCSADWKHCRFGEHQPVAQVSIVDRDSMNGADALVAELRKAEHRVPPISVTALAKALNMSARTLTSKAPVQCRQLRKRWDAYRSETRERKYREFCTRVDEYVKECVAQGWIPSGAAVREQFPNPAIFLAPQYAAYVKKSIEALALQA